MIIRSQLQFRPQQLCHASPEIATLPVSLLSNIKYFCQMIKHQILLSNYQTSNTLTNYQTPNTFMNSQFIFRLGGISRTYQGESVSQ